MGILGMFLATVLFFLGLFSALVAFEMYNTSTSGVQETTMMVTWLISAVCFGFSTVCLCLSRISYQIVKQSRLQNKEFPQEDESN
jgi:hypothetical protein